MASVEIGHRRLAPREVWRTRAAMTAHTAGLSGVATISEGSATVRPRGVQQS